MIVLTFNEGLPNRSLEINDLVYYIINTPAAGTNIIGINDNYGGSGFTTGDGGTGISTHNFLGVVSSIETVAVEDPGSFNQTTPPYNFKVFVEETTNIVNALPTSGDYFFFVKNSTVQQSAIKGYYNSIIMENNSTDKAELFTVSCDITESSK